MGDDMRSGHEYDNLPKEEFARSKWLITYTFIFGFTGTGTNIGIYWDGRITLNGAPSKGGQSSALIDDIPAFCAYPQRVFEWAYKTPAVHDDPRVRAYDMSSYWLEIEDTSDPKKGTYRKKISETIPIRKLCRDESKTSRVDIFYDDLVVPAVGQVDVDAPQVWSSVEIDHLISLLVKLRSKRSKFEEAVRHSEEAFERENRALNYNHVGAGLVTGWFRENPLLSTHSKPSPPPPAESGPEALRKYRKSLINAAMGSYSGGHAKKGTKHVGENQGLKAQEASGQDPVVHFDEEHVYHQRARMIQDMLDSSDFRQMTKFTATEIGGGRHGQKIKGPDGIRPTFVRRQDSIRASITQDSIVTFY